MEELRREEINATVRKWGTATRKKLADRILRLGIKDTGRLAGSLKVKFRTRAGEVDRVSFDFPYYGFFPEKGVGKYVPLSKVAQSRRSPRPWTRVIDMEVEKLADELVSEFGDAVLESITTRR